MINEKLIVALDANSMHQVKGLVETLGEKVKFYKVGMELFYNAGPEAIFYLRGLDKQIFLDLKLHDIPNTVAQSVTALTRLGVNMISIHAAGGRAMLEAAAKAATEASAAYGVSRPKLLAITVLTSIDDNEWHEVGGRLTVNEQVINFAKLAKSSGIDGVVASPLEAPVLRETCGDDFLIVTPGIRPLTAAANDQRRTAAPGEALRGGASHLVVGRPITAAANPGKAAEAIITDMEAAYE